MTRYRSRLAAGDTSAAWMVLLVIGVALLAARVVLAMRYGGGDFQPQGNESDAYDPLSSEVEDDNDSVPERPPHGTSTASRSGWKRGDNQI